LRGQIGADLVAGIEPSLLEFRQHFKDEKARLAVLDFDDLLQLAEDLVRGNAVVRKALIRRFATLFVDEFQDTSPIQASLVFFLSGAPESAGQQDWQQVVPAPGRLVLVGDPKQSIYRFRGADVETYKTCCELVCAADPDAMLQISTNFRTDGALVDWVNALFRSDSGLMEAPPEGGYQADYIDLLPWKVGEGCDNPVLVLTPEDHERVPGSGPTLELEARSVARYLKSKFGSGPTALGPDGKAIGFGDTAIIARTRKTLAVYAPALAREGIPFVLEGGGNLFEQEEVLCALTLLTAVTQPGRETAVVGSLRSVWFGINDDELAEHKLGGGTWNPVDGNRGLGHGRVNEALSVLGNLVQRSREVEPEQLITEVLRDGDHIALLRLRTSGIQGPMNLRMLESFLHGRLAAGGMSLASALRLAENLAQRESKEAGARLASQGAVRLMTAHASKGLEFGLVILAQPGRMPSNKHADPWWDDEGLVWRLSKDFQHPRFEDKSKWDKTRAAAEALRLFYVALTRAENYLLLPLFGSHQETKKHGVKSNLTVALSQSMGKYLQSQLEGFEDGDLPVGITALSTPAAATDASTPPDEALGNLRQGLAVACSADERSLRLQGRMAKGARSLAPSSLGDAFGASLNQSQDQATTPEAARQMGVLAHKCIELGFDYKASLAHCLKHKLDESAAAFVAECVQREGVLPSSLRAKEADRVFHEPPVQWTTVDDQGCSVVVRGFIDRLIQLDDGSVEVVDFKTDRIGPKELIDRAAHHQTQLALYGLALESAGLTVRSLTVAFLAIGQEVSTPFDDQARRLAQGALNPQT
jgi:ATP-dependent helicase/nuclease subunit A